MLPAVCSSTIRDWVLKCGLANLTMPREPGEWIWIIDSSIQMGAMKCVLILGIRMDQLKHNKDYTISQSDVVPLVLKTVESCPGEVIRDALMEAKDKTGEAIAVLSDEGSEIKRGVRLYAQTNPPLVHLNDILHKMDLVLKKELEGDETWKQFTKEVTNTMQELKLTSSAHLVPPKQRQKRRLRGEVKIIEWGRSIIRHLASGKATDLEKEKLSWIIKYESSLKSYQEMSNIFDVIVSAVRVRGYYRGLSQIIEQRGPLGERSQSFLRKALQMLKEEESKVPEGMRLLGSSEIIESMFGQFKQLEKNHCSGGLTSLVLSLPAMAGQWTSDLIKTTMEQVTIEKVKEWVTSNLGVTFCSRRRKDLRGTDRIRKGHYLELDECIAIANA